VSDNYDLPLSAALAYAALGWRVIPLHPGTKQPIPAAWQEKGTTDTDTILGWWDATYPDAGVGIVCGADSGLVVIDVDEHGISGSDTLADLEATYGELPETPCVLTGGGGRHLYFAYPAGVTIRNDAGKRLGPGLDIRAEGGQVVAPPSMHESGRAYAWEASSYPAPTSILFAAEPGTVALATMPGWLIDLLAAAPPERPPSVPRDPGDVGRLPGDRWAADHDWHDLLADDGATYLGTRTHHGDGTTYEVWGRPGVNHISATLGYGGSNVLKVFTSNWPGLDQDATYTKFGYLTATRHGGDFHAATAELEANGYPLDRGLDVTEIPLAQTEAEETTDPASLGLHSLGRLFEGDEPSYDWLVPGLIERGDRIIITGDEGYGKSTLLRQIGLGAVSGVNTLAKDPLMASHDPVGCVLLVDCENSERQLRREFPKALGPLEGVVALDDRFWLAMRTAGLSLDDPLDRAGDRRWLALAIKLLNVDLLLIGPLYKLLGGDPNAEQESRNTALYLDMLRGANAQMALVIEAHAPHGQKRPYGWSGWKRWPEFGLHLTDTGQLMPFRGGRDDARWWPRALARGGEGQWPWLPAEADVSDAGKEHEDYEQHVRVLVMRVFNATGRALTMAEVVERVGRRKAAVTQAVRFYQDNGWLIVTEMILHKADGRKHTVEAFRIDPNGPGGGVS